MSTAPAPRPGSVTTVVVLTWIVAIATLLTGVVLLLASDQSLNDAGIAASDAKTAGWVEIVLGALIAVVAIGLSGGANWARMLVTVLMVIRLVVAIWAGFMLTGHVGFWAIAFTAVLALAVLAMLWTGRASAFFNTN